MNKQSVIQFHYDYDYYFTTSRYVDFYEIASRFQNYICGDEDGCYLEYLARELNDDGRISEIEFAHLCEAQNTDENIALVLKFDFENKTIAVREYGKEKESVYGFEEVCAAARKTDVSELTEARRKQIFDEALNGKEIEHSPGNGQKIGGNMNVEIKLNSYEYEALEKALQQKGKDVNEEINRLAKELYLQEVSPEDRRQADEKQKEELHYNRLLNNVGMCSVFHLHSYDEDFYFIADNEVNFFRAASHYAYGDFEDVEHYGLRSFADGFYMKDSCDELTYSVLCKAQEHDVRIRCAIEFDFERRTLTVREQGGEPHTYGLNVVKEAIEFADRIPMLSEYNRKQIFDETLEGCEYRTEAEEAAEELKLSPP